MTKIKLCGLTRPEDIAAANALQPEYIGFVFAAKSKRAVSREIAAALKAQLSPGIQAVGVFVNEAPEAVADLLNAGIINIVQLAQNNVKGFLQRIEFNTLSAAGSVVFDSEIGIYEYKGLYRQVLKF